MAFFQNSGRLEPGVKLNLTLTTENGSESNGKQNETKSTAKIHTENLIVYLEIETKL